MTTTKKRINISLSGDLDTAIHELAKRDEVPQATKAVHLLRIALELEEDETLNRIAEQRDTKNAKFVSHKRAWA